MKRALYAKIAEAEFNLFNCLLIIVVFVPPGSRRKRKFEKSSHPGLFEFGLPRVGGCGFGHVVFRNRAVYGWVK